MLLLLLLSVFCYCHVHLHITSNKSISLYKILTELQQSSDMYSKLALNKIRLKNASKERKKKKRKKEEEEEEKAIVWVLVKV